MSGHFVAFLGISVLMIVTPGPDTALTIRNSLSGGRIAGIFTSVGVAAGQLIWAIAASAGVTAILMASQTVFHVIKLAGVAYLCFLGARSLQKAFRSKPAGSDSTERNAVHGMSAFVALRQGIFNDLSNPKMVVFFTSILPQFASEGRGMISELILLGAVFSLMTLLWLSLYSIVVATMVNFMKRPLVKRVIEGVTGIVLILLGAKLAIERQ